MDDVQNWRAARRSELLAARQAVSNNDRRAWTAAIRAHLSAALPLVRDLVIGYYVPFRGEPDVRPLLDEWRAAGAATALPVVKGRGLAMEFRLWWPGAPVLKGAFSLPGPDGTPLVTPAVVLMPPVGFDEQGYRLGYGGGYFDRTLAAMLPSPLKIGLAFELSRIATIRPQPYDIPMDYIVSEAGLYRVSAGQLLRLPPHTHLNLPYMPSPPPPTNADGDGDESQQLRPYASSPCYAGDLDPQE
jgi:5,10-methenyltetrahydrofolate synthetase